MKYKTCPNCGDKFCEEVWSKISGIGALGQHLNFYSNEKKLYFMKSFEDCEYIDVEDDELVSERVDFELHFCRECGHEFR